MNENEKKCFLLCSILLLISLNAEANDIFQMNRNALSEPKILAGYTGHGKGDSSETTLYCGIQGEVTMTSCKISLADGRPLRDDIEINLSQNWCNVTMPEVMEEDKAMWICRIGHSASSQFHERRVFLLEDDIDYRLPKNVRPVHYTINLLPFIIPDNFTFNGHVGIEIEVVEATDSITLHVNDITILEDIVSIADSDGGTIPIIGHSYEEERQFYTIHLESSIPPASYSMNIHFLGNLNNDLTGFYRSSYIDENGDQRWIATTQFEAVSARRAFPCFDEPALKATFQVNLGRTTEMSSISNMPMLSEGTDIPGTDYVLDVYETSVKMSTYLVAFVVSDFVFRKSEPQDNNVEFRIWSRRGAFNQTELASRAGPSILAFYEDYFQVPFPLPKQDMIAIPDFSAGAMENWGLVTYRETALLYAEGVTSASGKSRVIGMIAHELAHQWFGDLVTMEWWTDLWLNEGFATYTQYIGTNHFYPESEIIDKYALSAVHPALDLDALESSHPISIPVNSPDEISEIFDTISYQKGASVIRMMANFLSLETFNKGITNYLKGNAYGNANQDTLWAFLSEAGVEDETLPSGVTVKDIMDTWTLQKGFPVVTVARDYDNRGAYLDQERFLINPGSVNTSDPHDYEWWVPVNYAVAGDLESFERTSAANWIRPGEALYLADIQAAADQPILVNVQQTGFYRVNYDTENWRLIGDFLAADHTGIHRINRAQVLDDAFSLARSGQLDYRTALDSTSYLSQELDYIPWTAAFNGFNYIEKMLKRSPGFGDFRQYLTDALQPVYGRLGFFELPGDTVLESELRTKVVNGLCSLYDPECTANSVELFQEWMVAPNPDAESPIPTSIREIVLCTAIREGGEVEWDFLWSRYMMSNNGNEKSGFLNSLGCSLEDWILERYLASALDEASGVRKQDAYIVVGSVARNTVGRYIAWNWLRNNWLALTQLFDTTITSPVERMIQSIANDFNTEFDLEELERFAEENADTLGTAAVTTEQMIEGARINIDWMATHYQTIVDWLGEQESVFSTR